MKCFVLQSFAGPIYNSPAGKEIDLPRTEAESLQYHGIVRILESTPPPIAYEIPEVEKQNRMVKPQKRK